MADFQADRPEPARGPISEALAALNSVITGQSEEVGSILSVILGGGHVLLEDRPGVGKTVLAKALSTVLGLSMNRIQGTPDLMPTDISGIHVYNPADQSWPFHPGPIFASVVLVDEFNRATPKAQSALLEAMAERQVTVDGETTKLPDPFIVIATQNPRGEAGAYPLVSAQLDRFSYRSSLGLPSLSAQRDILIGTAGESKLSDVRPVFNQSSLRSAMDSVAEVEIVGTMIDYMLDLVQSVRDLDNSIWLSVRVPNTLAMNARGRALVNGRTYVAPEDIQAMIMGTVSHRLPAHVDASAVADVIANVAVPVTPPHG